MVNPLRSSWIVAGCTCGAEGKRPSAIVHSPGCALRSKERSNPHPSMDAKHDGRLDRLRKDVDTLETKRDEKAETESDAHTPAIKSLVEAIIDASENALRLNRRFRATITISEKGMEYRVETGWDTPREDS